MEIPCHKPMEICFSLHVSASKPDAIMEIKSQLQSLIRRLKTDIPGIKVAIFTHGDFGESNIYYVIKHTDMTTDPVDLNKWVTKATLERDRKRNKDAEEICYKVLFRESVLGLSWTADSQKILVIIGDENHNKSNASKIGDSWRDGVKRIADLVSVDPLNIT